MKKNMRNLTESFKQLVRYNEKISGKMGNPANMVNGWIEGYTADRPYNGEGCLICFQYTSLKDASDVKFYAMSEKEVLEMFHDLVSNLISVNESMNFALYIKGMTAMCRDYQHTGLDVNDWDMQFIIKSCYDAADDDAGGHDLLHLSTMDGFTIDNMINDMNDLRMRDISVAQFVAEQCMVLLNNEQRAA